MRRRYGGNTHRRYEQGREGDIVASVMSKDPCSGSIKEEHLAGIGVRSGMTNAIPRSTPGKSNNEWKLVGAAANRKQ